MMEKVHFALSWQTLPPDAFVLASMLSYKKKKKEKVIVKL